MEYVVYFKVCELYVVFHIGPNGTYAQTWRLRRGELFTVARQVAPLNCSPGAKSAVADCLVMAALRNRGPLYFCPVISIYLSIYLLFSSPNLSRRRLDVYHTSTHGVALVRI